VTTAATIHLAEPAAPPPEAVQHVSPLLRTLLKRDLEFRAYPPVPPDAPVPSDFHFIYRKADADPDALFPRLRWGGQVVFTSTRIADVYEVMRRFEPRGYVVSRGPGSMRRTWMGLYLPLLSRRVHYVMLRKVLLVPPREVSERFTYHVQLVTADDGSIIVQKEVPSVERVVARLRHRFPDMDEARLERRARKFTDKIFPLFLTREAAILKILQKNLPPEYAARVPAPLGLEKDSRGYVQRLWMNWLRVGGSPISQMDFAEQSADLLRALHEQAKVIHLDLRPDNIVITREGGVGFVDFGSAVRMGENLGENPLLSTVFEELMKTSEIQRMMGRMRDSGLLTSPIIDRGFQKVDPAVDLFFLALQFNSPQANPDLLGLVDFDPQSEDAAGLKALTDEVLRPHNAAHPTYCTAADLLKGVRALRRGEPVLREPCA
jgi:hypothetical protein